MVERHYPFKSIRDWYNRQEAKIPKLDAQWKAQGLSAKERAQRAFQIRCNARRQARSMMRNSHEVRKLQARDLVKYGRPDGPTFRQLVQERKKRGEKGDKIYENIIDSSQRTDKNRSPGFSSKKDSFKNFQDRARLRMYNRALLPKNLNLKSNAEVEDFLKNRQLKSRYGKPTEGQRGNIKPLKDRAKISSNQSDRASAKNKPSNPSAESRPSKKQGTGEKMSVKRSQSRAKYQERNQSLKKSRDQKAKPPTATRDNTKARYGKSSEANRTKELSASNRELKKSGNSIKSQQDSKSKPRGDSKPNRGGGGSRGKESRRR